MDYLIDDWSEHGHGFVTMAEEVTHHTEQTWYWVERFLNLPKKVRWMYCRDLRRGMREEWLHLPREVQLRLMDEHPDPDDGYKPTEGKPNESGMPTDVKYRFHFRVDTLTRIREAIWDDVLEVHRRAYQPGGDVRLVDDYEVLSAHMNRYGLISKTLTKLESMRRKVLDDLPGMILFRNIAEADRQAHDALLPLVMRIAESIDKRVEMVGGSIVSALEEDPTLINNRTLAYEVNDTDGDGVTEGVPHVDYGLFTIQRGQSCGNLRIRSPSGESRLVVPPAPQQAVCFPALELALRTGGRKTADWRDVEGARVPATWHGAVWCNGDTRGRSNLRFASITFVDGHHNFPCRNIDSPILKKMREQGLPLPAGVV